MFEEAVADNVAFCSPDKWSASTSLGNHLDLGRDPAGMETRARAGKQAARQPGGQAARRPST
eukprot:12720795-Heterocapsa_arctica.AAC.1